MNLGSLYLVSTPIGNLQDLGDRAKEILMTAEFILAEDTGKTGVMLQRLGIKRLGKLISNYEENEYRRIPEVIAWLKSGKNIALVTNAGTPLLSDPGYKLVQETIRSGFRVIPIPGPSALLSALVASGLPTDRFVFLGFLPKRDGRKKKLLSAVSEVNSKFLPTVVFYETANRLLGTMRMINEIFGEVKVVVAREMTKVYESFTRGKVSEILLELEKETKLKGEFTIVFQINEPQD